MKHEEAFRRTRFPFFALRGLMPYVGDIPVSPLRVTRSETIHSLEAAGAFGAIGLVFMATLRDETSPGTRVEDFYPVGMIAAVTARRREDPETPIAVAHGGIFPAHLTALSESEKFRQAEVEPRSPWFPETTLDHFWTQAESLVSFLQRLPHPPAAVSSFGDSFRGMPVTHFCFHGLSGGDFTLVEQLGLLSAESPEAALEYVQRLSGAKR